MDEDEQYKGEIPDYRIRHNELPEDLLEKLVMIVNTSMKTVSLEKDCCIDIVSKLKANR